MTKESKKMIIMTVIITAVTGFPYLQEGLCGYVPDLLYHMLRTEGVKDALLEGQFPVRIYENFFYGYGYGSPLFYPDIFLILPAVLRILFFSPLAAWKIFALCLTIVGTFTTYYSIKYISKDIDCSIAATFMIMLSQFWLADLHHRVGISEYLAFIFIPILIAGIYDFFVYGGKKTYLMGIGFGGLFLSHTIMTFIGVLITVIIFVRMLFIKREDNFLFDKYRMRNLIITAICTILIVAYHLFPMLEQMASGQFRYMTPWAQIGENVQPFSTFFRITGYFSVIAYVGIGVPILILMIVCLFLKKPKDKWAIGFLFGGWALYVMTTKVIPWEIFENTVLNMIQFTYRFWPWALVFTVIGITMILAENLKDQGKQKQIVLMAVIGCAILGGLFQNRMIAASTDQSKLIDAQYLEENSNYVGAGEWLPKEISDSVVNLTATPNVISDGENSQKLIDNGTYYSFQTDKISTSYTVPLIYYKGYEAWIDCEDGTRTQLSVAKSAEALVQVTNTTGLSGKIRVEYTGTAVQKVSTVISFMTVIGVGFYFIYTFKKGERLL